MKESFTKIFTGFLLVFLEIHIVAFDILPDPLGYFLIYLGLERISSEYKIGNLSRIFAMILFALSLPTVFIQQTNNEITGLTANDGWLLYMSALGIGKLILVFYVFRVMIQLAQHVGDESILKRTEPTFKVYIVTLLIVTSVEPFLMNSGRDIGSVIGILLIVVSLIMEIFFLVLLHEFRKIEPEGLDGGSQQIDLQV
ncbi:hypothetical protein [Alkalihalobacillus sp. TS-13]|uniref:hypothetical protein n=1 Tax=Alkalihalobacillus sp. TS-13 TaxID=2842455 RepID=UPI001C86CED5|nr:hypothetical protein [Alkalihalobacillus sp. TS-13]